MERMSTLLFLVETRPYGALGIGTIGAVKVHIEKDRELTFDTIRGIRNKLIDKEHERKREVLMVTLRKVDETFVG